MMVGVKKNNKQFISPSNGMKRMFECKIFVLKVVLKQFIFLCTVIAILRVM